MKKLVIILPVLIMAMFTLSGCGNTAANADSGDLNVSAPKESAVADCGHRGTDRDSMLAWKACMKEIRN